MVIKLRVDALPYELPIEVEWKGQKGKLHVWREQGDSSGISEGKSEDGFPVITSGNQGSYLCGWPDESLLSSIMKEQMTTAGLKPITLPDYLRVRQRVIYYFLLIMVKKMLLYLTLLKAKFS